MTAMHHDTMRDDKLAAIHRRIAELREAVDLIMKAESGEQRLDEIHRLLKEAEDIERQSLDMLLFLN